MSQIMDVAVPEAAGKGTRWATKRMILITLGVILVAILGAVITLDIELRFADSRAKAEDAAGDKIDAAKEPFLAKVTPELGDKDPHNSWVLDRKLTEKERKELNQFDGKSVKEASSLFRKFGARRILGEAAEYKLQLTSERKNAIVVTKVEAEATRCWEPTTAKTWAADGAGGVEQWKTIYFELKGRVKAPATTTNGNVDDPQMIPFDDAISVGMQQTPGLIKFSGRSEKSCEYRLVLSYNVNSGRTQTRTISKDEDGKNLLFEASPQGSYESVGREWGKWTFTSVAPKVAP
ncbi:hypothetical protein ACFV0R_13345 [Streptomyces sp. NPDC059578]|uniref:hypothetical protein n=1 Tax=Streptomyces sp. NPDC059578 TaxID=3346874 RepID=UPI003689275D